MMLVLEEQKGWLVRPGVMTDQYVINDLKAYKLLELHHDDVVLDLGACIGTYTCTAAMLTSRVVAYEPEPENFQVLLANVEQFDLHNIDARQRAVAASSSVVPFYLKSSWNHSTVHFRGRDDTIDVAADGFWDVVDEVKPSVVKMDIEGEEYNLALESAWPTFVRALAVELHQTRSEWKEATKGILQAWEQQGFKLLAVPHNSFQSLAIGVR